MVEQFLGLTPQAWLAIFAGISATFVSTGVVVAIRSLLVSAKIQRAQAVKSFMDDLAKTNEQRRYVFQEFPIQEDYEALDYASEKKVRDVINALNQIALLVDEKLLPAELVFSLCHTVVIRCWFKVEKYAQFYERKTGNRYGRRIGKLAERAKRFHDVRPHQRITAIQLESSQGKIAEVYRTKIETGFHGLVQKSGWWLCYRLGIY